MRFEYIDMQVEDRVGWLKYNRPPINSFNWKKLLEVPAALEIMLKDPGVRIIIFASTNEKYFSTGADLRMFENFKVREMEEWVGVCHEIVGQMRRADKPLLAAINGIATGGGLEIVLHCDIRFAANDARLGQPEINIGFIPPVGTTQSLARLLGRARAIRYLYEGSLLPAQEALDMGLVDILHPADRLHQEVQAYADRLAQKPAKALAAIRKTITLGGAMAFEDGLRMEYQIATELAGTKDFSEGIRAFLEKRKPQWE